MPECFGRDNVDSITFTAFVVVGWLILIFIIIIEGCSVDVVVVGGGGSDGEMFSDK